MQVTDQVALVTGSGSGIGEALALGLAHAGAHVVTTELPDRLDRAERVSAAIRAMGRESLALPLDVTRVPTIQETIDAAVRRFGGLDILVNNAGVQVARPALDVSEDDWDRVVDVNLRGVFFCAQAAGRVMVPRRSGCIINVASQNGVIGRTRSESMPLARRSCARRWAKRPSATPRCAPISSRAFLWGAWQNLRRLSVPSSIWPALLPRWSPAIRS